MYLLVLVHQFCRSSCRETITSRMIGRCLSAIVSLGEIFLWRVSSHFLAHRAVSTRFPEDSLGIKTRANLCENAYPAYLNNKPFLESYKSLTLEVAPQYVNKNEQRKVFSKEGESSQADSEFNLSSDSFAKTRRFQEATL